MLMSKINKINRLEYLSIDNPRPVNTKNNTDKFLENFGIKHNPYKNNINVIIVYCKYNFILYSIIIEIVVLLIIIYILYIIIKN